MPNVYVSALIRPQGPPGQIIMRFLENSFQIVLSPAIVEETVRAFAYPKVRKYIHAVRPKHKSREDLRFLGVIISLALAGDRHAQHHGAFAPSHVAAFLFPADERADRSRQDAAFHALHEREKLIPDAVSVKRRICTRDNARVRNRLPQKIRELWGADTHDGITFLHVG